MSLICGTKLESTARTARRVVTATAKCQTTRMHSSRMRTARCNCHFSYHACPPPRTPPTTHIPLPHMPPATHAPCHACPPTTHTPLAHTSPTTHAPLPCMPPCHACAPLPRTPSMFSAKIIG